MLLGLSRSALEADFAARCGAAANGVDLSQLRLSLMHGNGNIIALVDNSLSGLSDEDTGSTLAREVCQIFSTVRVDGIAFLSRTADQVKMTYFEGDGMHSVMCGNALRCATRYCAERGYIAESQDTILTDDGPKWVSAADGRIRVAVGAGREFQQVAEDRWFVFSGLPHLVLLVDDLNQVAVKAQGAALRYDEELCRTLHHREGLHVDFIQRADDRISIRTYEPGTEDETLACGTGVAGSAFVANKAWGLPYPVSVTTRGGEMTVVEHEDGHGLVISGTTDYLFSNI